MSLKDIGKYDVSEEAQAFKDKLASQGALLPHQHNRF